MALYYGKHKVKDYDTWRPLFDSDQERRESTGVKVVSVMRSADDSNDVHLVFDINDIGAFASMMQDPKMAEAMQQAGVLEQPVMYKLEAL